MLHALLLMREKGARGDNFPALWLCLDGLCCRRCGGTDLFSMWRPKGEHNRFDQEYIVSTEGREVSSSPSLLATHVWYYKF
jgi:hypothetical protein